MNNEFDAVPPVEIVTAEGERLVRKQGTSEFVKAEVNFDEPSDEAEYPEEFKDDLRTIRKWLRGEFELGDK